MPGNVGIVVIGRNEGERLGRCLTSVLGSGWPAVYVDSGSTDGSIGLAGRMGCEVVELDSAKPFTAARARNTGLIRLLELDPALEFVQFVDGDCEMASEWLERGVAELRSRPDVAVVCGRLRERFREASIYNRLCNTEWNAEIGEVSECGGIAMYRVPPFRAAGGFDSSVRAGEEPELCARLRAQGWKVLRLANEMALHDAAMTRFSQWWMRCVRGGYGAFEISQRGGLPQYARQVKSAQLWVLACSGLVVVGAGLSFFAPCRTAGVTLATAAVVAFAAQAVRIAVRAFPRAQEPRTAIAYGVFTMMSKWAQVIGHYQYLRRHWLRPTTSSAGEEAGDRGCREVALSKQHLSAAGFKQSSEERQQ